MLNPIPFTCHPPSSLPPSCILGQFNKLPLILSKNLFWHGFLFKTSGCECYSIVEHVLERSCVHAPDSHLPPTIIALGFDHPGIHWLSEMSTLQTFSEEVYLGDIADKLYKTSQYSWLWLTSWQLWFSTNEGFLHSLKMLFNPPLLHKLFFSNT